MRPTTRPYAAARPTGLAAAGAALALALTGCTGSSSGTPTGSSTSAVTAPSGGVGTGSSTSGTDGPGSATATTTTSPGTATSTASAAPAAETGASATAALTKALADQAAAVAKPGADGAGLRQGVYAAEALTAATAGGKLASTLNADQRADLALNPADAVVLATSRGAAYPRFIVAKSSTARTGRFTLLLLQAPDAGGGYRIVHQSTMLPGASVGSFDPVTVGSPLAADATGLAVAPQALLQAYAAGLAYPAPANPPAPVYAADAFAASLRDNVSSSVSALGAAVTVRQQHTPVRVVAAIRTARDKGAVVFGVIQRKDTLTEKTSGSLQANDAFRILSGRSSIDKQAVLTALEFVAWQVPTSGPAVTIAAADQATAATGS